MKAIRYFLDQAWTLAGTGLVLITLSGSTRTIGLWLSISALLLHFVAFLIPEDAPETSDEPEEWL